MLDMYGCDIVGAQMGFSKMAFSKSKRMFQKPGLCVCVSVGVCLWVCVCMCVCECVCMSVGVAPSATLATS